MTTYHHDNDLSGHHAAGRRTAGEILKHSEKQNFDVTITATAVFGDFYVKRVNAFIVTRSGKTTLVVAHPVEDSYPQTRRVIPDSTDFEKIYELVESIAKEKYREFISGILLSKGFRERD